ncbi:MAG: hypothetical protein WBM67_01130, partial [Sedimenticolaceae bacterium]
GLVQQTVQIVASHDLTLFVRMLHTLKATCMLHEGRSCESPMIEKLAVYPGRTDGFRAQPPAYQRLFLQMQVELDRHDKPEEQTQQRKIELATQQSAACRRH